MTLIRRHPALTFFVIAVVMTYGIGIAGHFALSRLQSTLGTAIPNVNDSVMRFGPSLAGLAAAWITLGRHEVWNILRRIGRWRAPIHVWLAAVALPPALIVVSFALLGQGAKWSSIDMELGVEVFAIQMLLAVLFAGLGEELGWRGFMLPRLAERNSFFLASVLVGLAWLAWHLPAYVLFGKGDDDPFLPFATIVIPFSIMLTWTYYRPGESLLFPILLHGSINASFYTLQALFPHVVAGAGFQPGFDWALAGLWVTVALITLLGLMGSFFASPLRSSRPS